MKKEIRRLTLTAAVTSVCALVYTFLIRLVDRAPIAADGSEVGFSHFNLWAKNLIGTSELWLKISELVGYVSLLVAASFAVLGLWQWMQRKKLTAVDASILTLGGFYVAVAAVYAFFEVAVVNRRPIWEDGVCEASYPSSHTVLMLCLLIGALPLIHSLVKNVKSAKILSVLAIALSVLGVVARLLSGVHWVSDIIGGILISASLILWFSVANRKFAKA